MSEIQISISLVCSVNQPNIFTHRLLTSPCIAQGILPLTAYFNCVNAAEAFNTAMAACDGKGWLVWVHQDVFLPPQWDTVFCGALARAIQQFPDLAIAGVYGVNGSGTSARRAGHVLDRGNLLRENTSLPCLVDSLDELLFAVRIDSGLRMDPSLGFDFYATDLVLQAQAVGAKSAVIDAYCEHWSETPIAGAPSDAAIERIARSASAFERKWFARFPVTTPCLHFEKPGDAVTYLQSLRVGSP